IQERYGTKKIFFKNFMDARVDYVVLPLAKRLMPPKQAAQVSDEGYFITTLLHEMAHGLGPTFARTPKGTVDIRDAIGPIFYSLDAEAIGNLTKEVIVIDATSDRQHAENWRDRYRTRTAILLTVLKTVSDLPVHLNATF